MMFFYLHYFLTNKYIQQQLMNINDLSKKVINSFELSESQQAQKQILLSTYKHKASRPPPSPSTVHTTSIVENDCIKQAQIAIGNLTKEIAAREILLAQCHRDLEQESTTN
ncbi:unnamed protein product [Rotaria magnacalcarata]|uniref:Uncharacterized protein n=2 Tax=Rotaria magnacalcarata TaxID=392030 RepID=A0A816W1F6_9BILA|nr:unnamed protein product [Rotaria magnacalcarata]